MACPTGTFVTTSASYDQHVDGLNGGLGLLVTNDQAGKGTLNTTTVSGIYAYQQAVSRNFSLSAGFQATYFQKSLDWNKLTFGDMIDPRRGFIYNTNDVPRGGSREQRRLLRRPDGLHRHLLCGLRGTPPDRTQ